MAQPINCQENEKDIPGQSDSFPDSDLQLDGRFYTRERDPPGQNTTYVYSGDNHKENDRIGTFSNFPKSPVDPRILAAAGFYYTGYKDRVKCFSCGSAVEHWIVGDNPLDVGWHKNNCEFKTKQNIKNVPQRRFVAEDFMRTIFTSSPNVNSTMEEEMEISDTQVKLGSNLNANTSVLGRGDLNNRLMYEPLAPLASVPDPEHKHLLSTLLLNKESDRRKTFLKWPSFPVPNFPPIFAKEGLYYLGELDRVQCFSCGGVLRNWGPNDIISEDHSSNFPDCRMVRGIDIRNIPLTDEERQNASPCTMQSTCNGEIETPAELPLSEQRRLQHKYPCRNPVSPNMRAEEDRFATFQEWNQPHIRATTRQIAAAGFYYLHQKDNVKCWYCNGGLQNWDPHDEPWTEHAKWFPRCEFLLRNRGEIFVRDLFRQNPNLPRPTIQNPANFEEGYDVPPTIDRQPDPEQNIIEQVVAMGFNRNHVVEAQNRKKQENGVGYTEPTELVSFLIANNVQQDSNTEQINAGGDGQPLSMETASLPSNLSSIQLVSNPIKNEEEGNDVVQRLNELQRGRVCKNCHDKIADTVLIPCGHLALCEECAVNMQRCPLCKENFTNKIRAYLS